MEANAAILAIVFAAVIAADAVACAIPIAAIKNDLDRLGVTERVQRALGPLKAAAAAGLTIGLWVPILGLATAGSLVVYFALAIATHVRHGDHLTRSLPALALLIWAAAVAAACFATAL